MRTEWIPVAMFLATVGLVAVSVLSAGVSYFLFRSRVDPHVIVYSKHDEDQASVLQIVIENIGFGPAYDVRFKLSQPIPGHAWGLSVAKAEEPSPPMSQGPLISGIPMLAPGETRVIGWGQYGGLIKAVGGGAIRVTAQFSSRRPFPWDPTDHVVESLLEVKSFEMTSAAESPIARQARAAETVAKQAERAIPLLRPLADLAQKASREIDQWSERQKAAEASQPPFLPSDRVPGLIEEDGEVGRLPPREDQCG